MPDVELRKAQIIMCGEWAGQSGPAVDACKREEERIYTDAKNRVGTDRKSLQRFVELYRKSYAAPFESCANDKATEAGGNFTATVANQVLACMANYRRGVPPASAGRISVYKVDNAGRVLRTNRERMTRRQFVDYIVDLAKCEGECKIVMPFPPNVVDFANKLGGKLGAQFLRLYTDLMARAPQKMQTDFNKRARVYREKVGDDLITTVKRRLRFRDPTRITPAQRPNMEKRLAATLGHDVTGTVRITGSGRRTRIVNTIRVVVKEVGSGREVSVNLGNDYKTIDNKRGLLNDAFYLRYEKSVGKQRNLIRRGALNEAAVVLNRDLSKFMRKNSDLDIRDIRVIGIKMHKKGLPGLGGTYKVIKKVLFGMDLSVPSDVLSTVVVNNPLVKNKYLGEIALRRIWRDIVDLDPRAGRSSKIRRAYADQLKRVLPRRIQANTITKKHLDPRTRKPEGAYVLLNTHVPKVENVKSSSPKAKLVTVPPGHPAFRDYSHDGMKNAKNIIVRRPVFKLANPKIKAIVGKVSDPDKKARLEKDLKEKVHRAAERRVIKLFKDNPNRKPWALLGARVKTVTLKPKKVNGREVIDPDTGLPDYDVIIELDEPGGFPITKDQRTRVHSYSIARAGGIHVTKNKAGEGSSSQFSGYIYSGLKVDHLLKGGTSAFVKLAVLLATAPEHPVPLVRVPHGEPAGFNIHRINDLNFGFEGKLAKNLKGKVALGYMTARGIQIFKVLGYGPFSDKDYLNEIANTTGSSKILGAEGSLIYVFDPKKKSFIGVTVKVGNAWQFVLGEDIKNFNASQRVIAGAQGQLDLGKVILAGAVSFDHSGPGFFSVPRPGGTPEEFKTRGANGVLAELGLVAQLTPAWFIFAGGRVFWSNAMVHDQSAKHSYLQAIGTAGVGYSGKHLQLGAGLDYILNKSTTDNSAWVLGQGGEDGVHDPNLHNISADFYLGWRWTAWKALFEVAGWVHASHSVSDKQTGIGGGAGLIVKY